MSDLKSLASDLLRLHHTDETLVLPTVWDVWSARAVVDAGFPALTIGSHPLADSRGQQDGEGMTLDDALDGIRRICSAVRVPVSADVESGYDTPAAELVERVLDAGAVGINVEDTVHSQDRVREVAEHADYIGALRQAADEADVELVINARTDALLHGTDLFPDPVAERGRPAAQQALRRERGQPDDGWRAQDREGLHAPTVVASALRGQAPTMTRNLTPSASRRRSATWMSRSFFDSPFPGPAVPRPSGPGTESARLSAPGAVPGRAEAEHPAELPGEVGVVGVAEVRGDRRQVGSRLLTDALGRLLQPAATDDLPRAHPDVRARQALHGAHGRTQSRGEVVDPQQGGVAVGQLDETPGRDRVGIRGHRRPHLRGEPDLEQPRCGGVPFVRVARAVHDPSDVRVEAGRPLRLGVAVPQRAHVADERMGRPRTQQGAHGPAAPGEVAPPGPGDRAVHPHRIGLDDELARREGQRQRLVHRPLRQVPLRHPEPPREGLSLRRREDPGDRRPGVRTQLALARDRLAHGPSVGAPTRLAQIFKRPALGLPSVVPMDTTTAATGQHTDHGVPHGFTSLTPFHTVQDAQGAIAWYERVFGARTVDVTHMPDGKGGTLVAHATLDFGRGRLQISDPMPDFGLVAPHEDDVVCSSIALYVPDVDAVVAEAQAAGATLREPLADFVSGDRFASIRDPHGLRWAVMTRVEDLSDEESAARVREWAAGQG